jgi:hypothetical protein
VLRVCQECGLLSLRRHCLRLAARRCDEFRTHLAPYLCRCKRNVLENLPAIEQVAVQTDTRKVHTSGKGGGGRGDL